ncbi:MarR family winged helix-turn-helix transcriptional regulator [Blautia sp. MSJ-19]|uniref:MarR family winged helix-turn-helix transcriptional regulator n=1 Tax=Blautia sp. MSJ-19 TaxID=2841517 RepID=UPI001C0F20F1|nr:helix-turn-helix domain-containing protein [Blautia sp. MSJ-19]MBU5481310.1 MarR family winged helix-turn-helix transcriptional regulator [Blautia sp. MSJ-19]
MNEFDEKLENMHMGRLVHMLSHQMKRNANSVASAIQNDELTIMQKHVLKFVLLESLHRDLYQKDIEEEFQIRKSTVTGILQLIEKHGYICRESVEKDARLKKIVPTPKAEELRPSLLEHIAFTENHLTKGISEKDVMICKKALCQMYHNLSEMNNQTGKEADRKDE